MAGWRPFTVLFGLALIVAGVWLLAVSPATTTQHRAWRPGEVIAITQDTGERDWEWTFHVANDGDRPLRVEATFTSNISIARGDDEGEWKIHTALLVDGVKMEPWDGYRLRGTALSAPGNWNRHDLTANWTLQPGEQSEVKATMKNEATPVPGRDWQVDYDPMQFEVTTATRALDWALAGPGTGLLLAGFAAVAVVAVPSRP